MLTGLTIIELSPGEAGLWRLPTMTPGTIIIKSFYAMPSGWRPSTPATPSEHGSGTPHDGTGGAGLHPPPEGMGADRPPRIHRDRGPPGSSGGLDDLDIDIGGSYGPTMELSLDLLRGGHVVPNVNPQNHTILHQTPNSGDIWALRVGRKQDGSLERRRYKIHVQYSSVLPVLTRTIPLGFFSRGFLKERRLLSDLLRVSRATSEKV